MKKTDVYVVVDTPKKAKKLKRVLDMFYIEWHINQFDGDFNYFYFEDDDLYSTRIKPKLTKVSIKELRNILAKEHLKAGDVVVAGINGIDNKWLVKFEYSINYGDFLGYYTSLQSSDELTSHTGSFDNFIRYATEEEKALLDPKKELEVGKWYKTQRSLFNHQDGCDSYGFFNKQWKSGDWRTYLCDFLFVTPVEANPQEVEQALIEEANRRYKVGDKLSLFNGHVYVSGNGIYSGDFDDLSFCIDSNTLAVKTTNGFYQMVFNNGQWAAVIEQDKFAELKEAHRNGAVIQWRREKFGNLIWEDCKENEPAWVHFNDYRIKPEAAQNFTDFDVAIVERLHDTLIDNHGYSLESKLLTDARMLANKIKSNIK